MTKDNKENLSSPVNQEDFVSEPLPQYLYDEEETPQERFEYDRQGTYTIADYMVLPEWQRVELIDGVFYDMYAPTSVHQILAADIWMKFKQHIAKNHGSCIPIASPLDVQLDRDEKTMVQPDVVVICDRSKITRERVFGDPDLVVEILSPSTRKKDMYIKLNKYRAASVREYWMVDPDEKTITVHDFEHDEAPAFYSFADQVPVGIFGGACLVDFAEIFEDVRFLYE